MHAVVKASSGPGAVFEQWPTPKPGLRDILVRIEATSICGTDMHIYDWHESIRDKVKPPMVMGHEFAGKIMEVGKEVSDLREGDIVSGETHINCGKCFQCRTGNGHICERMLLRGVDTDGCFAEYHMLHEQSAWLNDKTIPIETASAQEPLGNAVHAASAAEIPGNKVAIFGCGPIGACLIGLCKYFGTSKIRGVFGRRLWNTWYKTAEVLKAGEVDLSKVITHRFALEEFAEAFTLMKSGHSGKIVMYPNRKPPSS